MTARFLTLLVVMVVGFATRNEAVILYHTGDPQANTTAPTGELAGSGWQFQGRLGELLGTAIAPRFLISARHLSGFAPKFTYRGVTYDIVRRYDDPVSDLAIHEIDGRFPEYAPLYTRGDEVGRRLMVFGRGTQRGSDRIVDGELRGWHWGISDTVQRWGENQVSSIVQRGGSDMLRVAFDGPGLPHEAHLSGGDSGGALFIQDETDGAWKLAGINSDVDRFSSGASGGGPYEAAMFDMRGSYSRNGTLITGSAPVPSNFYAARISSRIEWIMSIIGPELANISARAVVGDAQRVAIGGFIIRGAPGEAKRILVRGLGPSLQVNGAPLPNRLGDPVVELVAASGSTISANDNWQTSQGAELQQVGFAPTDEREAALIATLPTGEYTAILSGSGSSAGTGLIEIYDLENGIESALRNLSARAFVDSAEQLLIGGVIVRAGTKRLLVRAIGPTLSDRGVPGELPDPLLEIYDSAGSLVAANDNWTSASNRSEISASGLAPNNARESAILIPASLGAYTAVVRSASGATGIGLLEAYLLD